MPVHQIKKGRWIAKSPTGTLPDDPLNEDFKKLLIRWKKAEGEGRKVKIDPNRKLPPYAFRHAFVAAALNAGGDLKGVSEMAGHSRTETTTRIYQHTNINLHRGIVENLPKIVVDG